MLMGMDISSEISQNDTMLKGIKSIGPNIVQTEMDIKSNWSSWVGCP
jgi:hypothetical protein